MEELISRKKLLADLNGVKEVLAAQGDPFLANILHRAIRCVENQPAAAQAASETEMDALKDRKLEKAILELRQNYEKAKSAGYVMNKLGWALYQTWQKYE